MTVVVILIRVMMMTVKSLLLSLMMMLMTMMVLVVVVVVVVVIDRLNDSLNDVRRCTENTRTLYGNKTKKKETHVETNVKEANEQINMYMV